tara:strand:- start:1338 stop:1700 length:363 start_codon:yes stop_codon:yes gene_type:complete
MPDLRSLILSSKDTPTDVVEVPEWGVTVGIKSMSARSRASVMASAQQGAEGFDEAGVLAMWGRTLVDCLVDPETGDTIFTHDDIMDLMEKSASVVERLWTHCFERSGMTEAKVNEAGKDS